MQHFYLSIIALSLACQEIHTMAKQLSAKLVTTKSVALIAASSTARAGIYYFVKIVQKNLRLRKAEQALREAAQSGDIDAVNAALNAGAYINTETPAVVGKDGCYNDDWNFTPLMYAIKNQHTPVIQALLTKGAAIRVPNKALRLYSINLVIKTKNAEIIKIFAQHSDDARNLLLEVAKRDFKDKELIGLVHEIVEDYRASVATATVAQV